MRNVASFNFEHVFIEKYDFFSRIFEHLLKGFNNAGGGKYAEYYTPRAIAQVTRRDLLRPIGWNRYIAYGSCSSDRRR